MHVTLYNIPGDWFYSTGLMWKDQKVLATVIGVEKCWCKEGWQDFKWFMVSGWISLNVEPKAYRASKGTATPQQGRISPSYSSIYFSLIYIFSSKYQFLYLQHSLTTSFFLVVSGRAHGAVVDALVDGGGPHSARDGGLCVSRLPPLCHYHLL